MTVEQEQVRSSRFYDDTVAAGPTMETPADLTSTADLDSLRSQVNRLYDGSGTGDWYQDIAAAGFDSFGIKQIHDKKLFYVDPFDTSVQQFTLGAGALGILISNALVSRTPKTIAVGPSSTDTGGVAAALEANFTTAGTLGVGLTTSVDSGGILLNKIDIINDATNEAPTDNDDVVFGLVQAVAGTSDGTAIAAAASENLQISFVKIDAATNALTAVTLPDGTYNFNLRRCSNLFSLPAGALVSPNAALPDAIDPDNAAARLPWREYSISAPGPILGPAASDPVNVTSGVFTTAGAQTSQSTFGTPALPATAAEFRDDNRVKIWRNGVLQSKENLVNWISTTQFSFSRRLFIGERISWEMPATY